MAKIQVTRGLASKLTPNPDEVLQDLLFEAPDELMGEYMTMDNPVEVEVSDETAGVLTSLAHDFGLTPLGLCVVLERVYPRTMELKVKFNEFTRRSAS